MKCSGDGDKEAICFISTFRAEKTALRRSAGGKGESIRLIFILRKAVAIRAGMPKRQMVGDCLEWCCCVYFALLSVGADINHDSSAAHTCMPPSPQREKYSSLFGIFVNLNLFWILLDKCVI